MVFVAADCEFEKGQELKIKNWNDVVKEDDDVIVLGNFYKASLEDYQKLLKRLNGIKSIIDSKNQHYNETQLKACGFARAKTINGFIPTRENIDFVTYVIVEPELLEKNHSYKIATASSLMKNDIVFNNDILSLSFKYWDNTPIEYYQIPYIIKNLSEYQQIKEGENG